MTTAFLPIHASVLLSKITTLTEPAAATEPAALPLMTQVRICCADFALTRIPVMPELPAEEDT